jgi:NADPH:quinone reductase
MSQLERDSSVGLRVQVSALAETPLEGVEQNLRFESYPMPDPSLLKAGEVIIAVRSAAVGWVDLIMTSGQYQHAPRLPYTPGLEYAGDIIAVGSEVDTAMAAMGDAVFVDCFTVGPRTSGAYQSAGGYASYAVVPASAVRRIPDGLSYNEACNFAGNYETAYHCVVARGQLQAHETILIHGASGSTGLAAVQMAKCLGATVIATGRSAEKLDVVKSQGADHVICIRREDGEPGVKRFRDEVKALTGGKGVDVVYDGVGGAVSLESLRCVRFGARFLVVGWASTPFVAKGKGGRGAPNANQLPTNLILMKGLDVLGCPAVISAQHDPGLRTQRNLDLMKWVKAGRLKPYVSHVFALKDAKQALLAKWRGEVIAGCVVNPPHSHEGV